MTEDIEHGDAKHSTILMSVEFIFIPTELILFSWNSGCGFLAKKLVEPSRVIVACVRTRSVELSYRYEIMIFFQLSTQSGGLSFIEYAMPPLLLTKRCHMTCLSRRKKKRDSKAE